MDADRPLRAVADAPHELTARRVDVVAAGLADRRHVALVDQRLLERKDSRARTGAELGAGERVPGNEVEFARHAANTGGERARVPGRIVDSVEHHVFERDEIARGALEIADARVEERRDRVLAVDRHEAVAQRVVGRVQRHGQRDGAIVAQPVDRRNDSRRRQRHAATRQSVGVVVEKDAERRAHAVVIRERLAHAHHHDVGDRRAPVLDPRHMVCSLGAARRPSEREQFGLGAALRPHDRVRQQRAICMP